MKQLPEWLQNNEPYVPPKGSGSFIAKTLRTLAGVAARLRIQHGHEKTHHLPAVFKLIVLVASLIILSVSRSIYIPLAYGAIINTYLCTWKARDILNILKSAFFAYFISCLILAPSILINPNGSANMLLITVKVFLSVEMVNILNHTTQWNHLTHALRQFKVPSVFIFTLDTTLKYIALSGELITALLTSLSLRSVGKNTYKNKSAGSVMGTVFIASAESCGKMYEAMVCRSFTGDYEGFYDGTDNDK